MNTIQIQTDLLAKFPGPDEDGHDPNSPVYCPVEDRSLWLSPHIQYDAPDFGPLFRINFEYLLRLQPRFPSLIPKIKYYLEIGTFEGRSAFHVLATLMNSQEPDLSVEVTCIDPFLQSFSKETADINEVKEIFLKNLIHVGYDSPVCPSFYYDDFQTILPRLFRNREMQTVGATPMSGSNPDLIYIDGDHHRHAVLKDLICAERLIKFCGIILIDDVGQYCLHETPDREVYLGLKDWLSLTPICSNTKDITEIQLPDSYQRAFLITKGTV